MDDNNEEGNIDIPETQWHSICIHQFVKIDNTSRFFCRHWEFRFGIPFFVICIIVYCCSVFALAIYVDLPSKTYKIISLIDIIIFLVLFLWSYFSAMCMDPGFLPYNWSTTKQSWYNWEYQLTNLAITQEKIDFAYKHEKPPRSSFSKSAGRFVVRPDHICGWVSNWIGKRNHKQFILMCLYGSMFALSLFSWRFAPNRSLKAKSKTLYICEIVAAVFEGFFTLVLFVDFISNLYDLSMNKTQLQKMKMKQDEGMEINDEKLGLLESFHQVCGYGNPVCWICPIPAFGKELFVK